MLPRISVCAPARATGAKACSRVVGMGRHCAVKSRAWLPILNSGFAFRLTEGGAIMDTHNFQKMVYSYSEGWQDLMRMHPGVNRLMWMYVAPMSLVPAVMFMYAMVVTPGAVLPAVIPYLSTGEALAVGAAFFVIEIGMVALMASL